MIAHIADMLPPASATALALQTDPSTHVCSQLEEQRRRNEPPSESELIRRAEKDTVHAKAMACLQEQRDEVKVMSAMLAYAKCAAIRCAAQDRH